MYIKADKKDKASEILSESLEIANKIPLAFEKATALENIAFLYVKIDKDMARKIISDSLAIANTISISMNCAQISGYVMRADTLAKIGRKYMEMGEQGKACMVLAEAFQLSQIPQGSRSTFVVFSTVDTLIELAEKFAENGKKIDENTEAALQEIKKALPK
ncbi:MAG: hypothetical protein FJZ15_00895 [Candidatus Omnitrophica bacterium]|nr:hypothetical protein [Candidatus Omnitrophota bacterium]